MDSRNYQGSDPDDIPADRNAELCASLMQHPGWALLDRLTDVEIERRRTMLEDHRHDESETAYQRGILAGLRLVISMPKTEIEAARNRGKR